MNKVKNPYSEFWLQFVKIVLILYSFSKSALLGFMVLAYIFYIGSLFDNVIHQLEAALEESDEPQEFIEPNRTADKIHPYKDCVIEQYGTDFYIMKPSGDRLEKVFKTFTDAKEEIDVIYPLFPKTAKERSKIFNIRFVK